MGIRIRSRRTAARRCVLALATVVASTLALGGCSGIPSSSAPQTVQVLGEAASTPTVGPVPGIDARTLVRDFLNLYPGALAAARQYLTPAARVQWKPSTVTILADDATTGSYRNHSVTVTGRVVGRLSAAGVYTPTISSSVTSSQAFTFGVTRVGGEHRISSLPHNSGGLLITVSQFKASYPPRPIYFFDTDNRYLVPDLRYTALSDPAQLTNWLLTQLVAGPRSELQNSVNTDTIPTGQGRQVSASLGSSGTKLQVPFSSQLGAAARYRLAAELVETLAANDLYGPSSIYDGDTRVTVPGADSAALVKNDFDAVLGPPAPARVVYYLDGQDRIRSTAGGVLPGVLGADNAFQSFAIAKPSSIGELAVAAVRQDRDRQGRPLGAERLLIGTRSGGFRLTSVQGLLTRPTWAPQRAGSKVAEVWVAAGSKLYQVSTNGQTSSVQTVGIAPATISRIVSVRFSPDGSRIAVVAGNADSAQLFEGPVVRAANGPTVNLTQISPAGTAITDVAWTTPDHLFATGCLDAQCSGAATQDARIFDTFVDGSRWTERGLINLPAAPTTLTAAPNSFIWVATADDYVWKQGSGTWVSPQGYAQTPGTVPVYLE